LLLAVVKSSGKLVVDPAAAVEVVVSSAADIALGNWFEGIEELDSAGTALEVLVDFAEVAVMTCLGLSTFDP
jgi:hypothetical protein